MKNGFTLVELSIVLVIIGLLIGGILVGQSLIESAKINATISQISQFDSGVNSFRSKYKNLPGDAPAFGGNGDGSLSRLNSCKAVDFFIDEVRTFFANLFPHKYINTGAAFESPEAGKNVPESKIGNNNSFFVASSLAASNGTYCANNNGHNYYIILDGSTQAGDRSFNVTTASTSCCSPIENLSIDTKLDDGLADSGAVIAGAMKETETGTGAAYNAPLTECATGALYASDSKSSSCTPLIRIGVQTGDLQ